MKIDIAGGIGFIYGASAQIITVVRETITPEDTSLKSLAFKFRSGIVNGKQTIQMAGSEVSHSKEFEEELKKRLIEMYPNIGSTNKCNK